MSSLFRSSRGRYAFTLMELLVVVGIVALLMGILLPVLGAARNSAKGSASLLNLRQLNLGLAAYAADRKDFLPMHASLVMPIQGTIPRWVDYIFPYVPDPLSFISPQLDERERTVDFQHRFWHAVSDVSAEVAARNREFADQGRKDPVLDLYHGGYGYNFQYLGNSFQPGNIPTYHGNMSRDIVQPSDTVAIGDTAGSRGGSASAQPGEGGLGTTVIDPPIGSMTLGSKGSRRTSATPGSGNAYHEAGDDQNHNPFVKDFTYTHRSAPRLRNGDTTNMVYLDGHAVAIAPDLLDDPDADGMADNAAFNGRGSPHLR